jgi:IS4 transposase
MAHGRTLFARLVELLPRRAFESAVARYQGDRRVRTLSCMDQMLVMIYAQLTCRSSLRETALCLAAMGMQRYHCGIRGNVARSSLADANESRDYRIFRDTALRMIEAARRELPVDPELKTLDAEIYALDASTIDLCLKLFPWAKFRRRKGAVKLHTLMDLKAQIPVFIAVSDGKFHEIHTLDTLQIEPGSYLVIDKGYIDFKRLYRLHQAGCFFVTRAKKVMIHRVQSRRPVKRGGPVQSDQLIRLRIYRTRKRYPDTLRRVSYIDPETKKKLVFITNDQLLPPETIALLYRKRWQIELFFKWIKQHLHIKAFFGRSRNAVCIQVWVAVIVFVLVLRFRQRHDLPHAPGEIMSILSAMLLEKTPVNEVFRETGEQIADTHGHNQLELF